MGRVAIAGRHAVLTFALPEDEFRAIVAKAARTSELRMADVGPEGEKHSADEPDRRHAEWARATVGKEFER